MQTYRLRHRDHTTLFEGEYHTHRECIEDALNQAICLDGAVLRDVSFTGANLTGANISEAELYYCQFDNASLFNVCFAHSDLTGSLFTYTGFGGTDLTGTILDSCLFSGLSALSLNFQSCDSMHNTLYQSSTRRCEMSVPPVVVGGLNEPIALFDRDILIGNTLFSTVNSIWLRDASYAALHPKGEVSPDLYKSLSLLQRLKSAYTDNHISINAKSTKS
jgi:uncharacterized protein YjbI with pentapeptide repeats